MLVREHKIDQSEKIKLLISTLALALFLVFVANVFFLLFYISQHINEPTFQTLKLSFSNGYLIVNNEKVGFSLFFNFVGLFILWFLMTYHTLKVIKKPFLSIFL